MGIDLKKITVQQKDKIFALQENHYVDLKSIDIAPAKLTQTISAFANADGGEIYIGVEEKERNKGIPFREWRGFFNIEAANGHIQAFEKYFPLGQYYDYTFLECDGCTGFVLKVEIHKTKEIVRASNDKIYIRRSAQKFLVDTPDAISRLKLDKGVTSFETETIEIDKELILESKIFKDFIKGVIPSTSTEEWLKKQFFLINNKFTVSGILLFAEEPQAILPKRCGIKIYRYKTQDKEGSRETLASDPITIEGCIYDQIKNAVDKTVEIIESIETLTEDGMKKLKYPHETLHEIITNAVLHRDYSILTDIHIKIFDNRIEIESPGKLAGHVTVEQILKQQFARNGAIIRMINKFPNPPNKDIGEGLNTAFDAMRKHRLKNPIIKENQNSVWISIRHEPLGSPEEIIIEYLHNNAEITNKIGRKICFIDSESTIRKKLQKMMDGNVLEKVPEKKGRATAYRLTAKKENTISS